MKYPNLDKSKLIGFDIETYDPELTTKGTGVYRKDGYILGVSLSDGDFSEYYNLGHSGFEKNEKEHNLKYLKSVLKNDAPKVAANIFYDYDWLVNGYGFEINGKLHDVQIAEPLICEYRDSFSLDNLAKHYLNKTKEKTEIDEFCLEHNLKGDSRKWLWKMSYELVREYAKTDAKLLVPILSKQMFILKEEDLLKLYEIETGLIRMLMQMKKIGVRLDVKAVDKKIDFLMRTIEENKKKMTDVYGEFNVKSPKQIAALFDKLKIPYSRKAPTEKMRAKGVLIGNPTTDKDALKAIDHDLPKSILKLREYRTILQTFFINSFTNLRVGERLHANFQPLKSDSYGTISGRFSSTKPNLQQIPSKKETMGDFCREVFLPEPGYVWGKLDWSQIEYRFIAHYAKGEKANLIREKYNNNPHTDYHKMIMDLTGFDRKTAKMLNFGMAYFMGVFSCSKKFGWTLEEAKSFIDAYHAEVPFIKTTREHVVRVAKIRGFVKTILKRRARISPKMAENKKEYSIFNRLIQGSAADLMKKAMYDAYNEDLFKILIPHLTVHDELNVSIPQTKKGREAILKLKFIMENCLKLRVPIIADLEIGTNWANVSKENAEKFLKGEKIC